MSNSVFKKNALYLLASKGTNFIFPLISYTYLISILSFDHLGIISFTQIVADFIIIFCDFGFNLSGAKQITETSQNIKLRNKIINSIYYLKWILVLISILFINLIFYYIPSLVETQYIVNLFFVYVIGQSFMPFWFFQGIQKSKYITIINIIGKVLLFILIVIFINHNDDYLLYPLLLGLSLMLPLGISLLIMIKKEKFIFIKPKVKDIIIQFKLSYHFFIATLNDGIIGYSPILLLKITLPSHMSNYAIGVYSVAEKYIKPICYLTQPISQALFPHIIEKSKNNLNGAIRYIIKVSTLIGVLMLIFSIISYCFGARVLSHEMLAGKEFYTCVPAYSILCILPLFYSQVRLLGTQTLLVLNKEQILSKIYLITTFITIGLGYFLTKSYSYIGAAIILPLANVIMYMVMGVFILKFRSIWQKK